MEKRKMCSRCGGRMFLEYDYESRRYDFVCISCGHLEPSAPAVPAVNSEAAERQSRRVAALARV